MRAKYKFVANKVQGVSICIVGLSPFVDTNIYICSVCPSLRMFLKFLNKKKIPLLPICVFKKKPMPLHCPYVLKTKCRPDANANAMRININFVMQMQMQMKKESSE